MAQCIVIICFTAVRVSEDYHYEKLYDVIKSLYY